jgi:hypothetical protein
MYYFYIFLNKKHFKNQSQSQLLKRKPAAWTGWLRDVGGGVNNFQFLEGSGIWNEKTKNKKFQEAQLIHIITL